jgi:rhamnosyltransferase
MTLVHIAEERYRLFQYRRSNRKRHKTGMIDPASYNPKRKNSGMDRTNNINHDQSCCAVIVTYHPSPYMVDNLRNVSAQVQGLVVVDNGSTTEELNLLHQASESLGFHLIENSENLGIAEGLNQGVVWAKNRGYPWVILFDQDSRIPDGFAEKMFASWKSHQAREYIGSMHPRYVDPNTQIEPTVLRAKDGGPVTSLTSGALMPVWIFDKIGLFSSEYFIDQVDIEYCFRIRAANYLVADSRDAILFHAPGAPKRLRFFFFSFEPTHHSALRRYYLSRNRVAVFKKYFRVFPNMVLQTMNIAFCETIKCFLVESERPRKFRNFLLGTWDGFIGRMGKRENL